MWVAGCQAAAPGTGMRRGHTSHTSEKTRTAKSLRRASARSTHHHPPPQATRGQHQAQRQQLSWLKNRKQIVGDMNGRYREATPSAWRAQDSPRRAETVNIPRTPGSPTSNSIAALESSSPAETRPPQNASVWASFSLGKAPFTSSTVGYSSHNATMASQSLDDSDITVSDVIWGGRHAHHTHNRRPSES